MHERYETFTVLINRICRNIRKIKIQEMADYTLRSAHVSCLYYLYTSDGATATELCERCEEDKATISRALGYLETNGYIQCAATCTKRYRSTLMLTEKGRMVGKTIADKIQGLLEGISGKLTDDERAVFYRTLSMISESLENVSKSSTK